MGYSLFRATRDAPARGLRAGDIVRVPAENRAIYKSRKGFEEVYDEYAVAGPTEVAAIRTRKPRYVGGGWWELADGTKVRGAKDAPPG